MARDDLPAAWLREIEAEVDPAAIDTSPAGREWAAADAAGAYRLGAQRNLAAAPLAVVRPAGLDAVVATVRWAARHGLPVVARGGGTGVMGGAAPLRAGVVLDLGRLDDVAVHAEDMLAETGAGAVLADVNAALRPHGLMLGHDPWSVGIATAGGALGTDGVGYMAGRWGSMGEQVAGLEAVLADGSVVRTRLFKPPAGPRLAGLFAGAQGTLGVVTRLWLHAVPLPETEAFRTYRFAGFEAGYAAVCALWRTGVRYDLLDFTDGPPERFDLQPGCEDAAGWTGVLHLAALGQPEDVEGRMAVAARVLTGAGGADVGREPAATYWDERHAIAERYAREIHGPRDALARRRAGERGFDYLNLALPPGRVVPYRRRAVERVAGEKDFILHETGIWCRPEIFSLTIGEPGALEATERRGAGRAGARMAALMDDLLRAALAEGGNVECIHGPGLKLLPLLAADLGAALPVLRRLKTALDPQDLLNPGKWGETDERATGR